MEVLLIEEGGIETTSPVCCTTCYSELQPYNRNEIEKGTEIAYLHAISSGRVKKRFVGLGGAAITH